LSTPGTPWMARKIFEPEHDAFRDSVRRFMEKEALPYQAEWEAAGEAGRDDWLKAAECGFVGFEAPQQYGGLGINDFRYNAILNEEAMSLGVSADPTHSASCSSRRGCRDSLAVANST